MTIMLLVRYANLRGAGQPFEHRGRLVELLAVRVLIVLLQCALLLLRTRKCINLQGSQFEILLLFDHCKNGLIYLQQALRECVVTLPYDSPTPLVESVDVQVLGGDHVHKILEDVIVNAYGSGVEPLNGHHVALVTLCYCQQINGKLLLIYAGVG